MIAPGQKAIIQVIVATRCDLRCSNCTQQIAHVKDRSWMTLENFRAAVRSLADWHGIIGVFGGNPCLHPQFPELCQIIREEIPDRRRRGLWSNNVNGYGAVIAETFGYFNLNVHTEGAKADEMRRDVIVPLRGTAGVDARSLQVFGEHRQSWHAPTLVAIRDMIGTPGGPADEAAMWAMIERCDINRNWSGAIAQRRGELRAYFCEVAAAFDNVRDEDHGIPVTPGWWRLGMDAFEHQARRWCPDCGVPLKMRGHQDREDTDDISRTWADLTVNGKRRHVLHESVDQEHTHEATDYLEFRR